MATSYRDRYAQKNKGKVSIAGKGTVKRTSSTNTGKSYSVNQKTKDKVKEDTKKYFTVNNRQDSAKKKDSNLSFRQSDGSFKSGVKAQQTNESKQKIQSGRDKGKYWTDVAGKKSTNKNITPISDPTQSGDYLFTTQTQEKYRGTGENKLRSQIDLNTNAISNKYKPAQEKLNNYEEDFRADYEADREEALNRLHSAQTLGALAEQNPEMNGAQEAAQLADENAKQSQVKESSSEAAWLKAKEVETQKSDLNLVKKAEIDSSNQEIYKQEAEEGNITEKAKRGAEIKDIFNTFEDKEAQKYMTADEKQTYDALKTTSVGTAHGYYRSLQDELFDRQAQAQYRKDKDTDEAVSAKIKELNGNPWTSPLASQVAQFVYDKGRELQRSGITAVSALRRWGKDINNLPAALAGGEDVLYETALEKYHQYQRADMQGLEAVTNDLLDNLVYQLPNTGLAAVTGGAGLAVNTGLVFATSYSSSYTQALSEGYDPGTAQEYAFASGFSEAGTSFLLKGTALAGKGVIPMLFEDKTAGSSFSAILKGYFKDMGSEGLEEALQEIMGTIIGNNILGKNDDINWQNVAYAGTLGSLSAGIMNGLSQNSLVREAQIEVRSEKRAEMNAQSAQLYREGIDTLLDTVSGVLPENSKNLRELEKLSRDLQRGKNIPDERVNEVCDNALKESRDLAVKQSINDTVTELESVEENVVNATQNAENAERNAEAVANNRQLENVAYSQQNTEALTPGQQKAVKYGRPAVNEDGSINVGRVTTIRSPYTAELPTQNKSGSSGKITIEQSSIDTARSKIEEAKNSNKNGEKRSVKSILTSLYKGVFGDKFKNGVKVDGMTMDGTDYIVSVGNNVVSKVISDSRLNAEKLAVLDNIQEVIKSADYLGSAPYSKNNANKSANTIRYDYFENEVNIGGRDYTISFDVQALKNKHNNFRTYRIDEIKISDSQRTDVVSPLTTVAENRSFNDVNISNENVTQPTSEVNPKRTSNIAEHAKNSKFMTAEGAKRMQELIDNGAFDYEVYTDKKAVNEAQKSIEKNGVEVVANSFSKKVANGEMLTKTDVVEAQKAFEAYIKNGQTDEAMSLLFDMRASATNAGQIAQAFSLMDYATPAGRVMLVEKIRDRLQGDIERRYKKSGVKLEINKGLLEQLGKAETAQDAQVVQNTIIADLTEQLPVSMSDRATAWRYFAMLANPKTHIRNIVGNVAFVPMVEAKNGIGALLEKTLPKEQRTKAVITPKDKALTDFARQQFEANKDSLGQSNRNNDTQELWNNRKLFGDTKFESFRRVVMGALEGEDMMFKKRAYVSSYAQAMKARGYTAETITDKAKIEIHGYSAQEALKATYQDASKLAQTLNRLSKQSGAGRFVIEGLVPFKKTPVNILKRGIEYSPIGLVRGIYDMTTKVKNGEMSATQGIDSIASGLTGVSVMALGALLKSMGVVEIGSDDDNEETMNKLTGGQSYALRIGDSTYTIDWMVPTAMPLLTGAYVQRTFEDGFSVTDFADCLNAITKMSEPLMETSMLQGLSNAITYASYGDTDSALVNVAIGAVESYGGQFVPSVANMFARITDDTQRAYYHDKTTGVPGAVQSVVYTAMNKIPGVSMLLNPKVDRWGREIHTDTAKRVLEATVSPGYYSQDNITDVDKEINRLYAQIGDGGVIPPAPSKYMTVNGERKEFNSEEYVKFQKSLGSQAFDGVESLIKTQAYKDMTDKEKAAAIKIVYDYAKQNAYYELNSSYQRDTWADVLSGNGIDIGTYAGYKTRAKELDDDSELTTAQKKSQKIQLIQGMDDKYKADMYALEFEDGDTAKEKTISYASSIGVKPDTFMQYFADGVNSFSADKDENGNSVSGTKKAKVLAYIANMDISDKQKIYFATVIAGYKIDDVSEINGYASGNGYSKGKGKTSKGGSGKGKGRSSGSSKASKPDFSPLLNIAKKSSTSNTASPTSGLDFTYSTKLFAKDHNTIVKDTKARELAQIDNNPMYTSAMKNRLKQEIERRYG